MLRASAQLSPTLLISAVYTILMPRLETTTLQTLQQTIQLRQIQQTRPLQTAAQVATLVQPTTLRPIVLVTILLRPTQLVIAPARTRLMEQQTNYLAICRQMDWHKDS